jgi:hypothetical protein
LFTSFEVPPLSRDKVFRSALLCDSYYFRGEAVAKQIQNVQGSHVNSKKVSHPKKTFAGVQNVSLALSLILNLEHNF